MVSELEKTSLEISLKVMSSQVSTPPLIGGMCLLICDTNI